MSLCIFFVPFTLTSNYFYLYPSPFCFPSFRPLSRCLWGPWRIKKMGTSRLSLQRLTGTRKWIYKWKGKLWNWEQFSPLLPFFKVGYSDLTMSTQLSSIREACEEVLRCARLPACLGFCVTITGLMKVVTREVVTRKRLLRWLSLTKSLGNFCSGVREPTCSRALTLSP